MRYYLAPILPPQPPPSDPDAAWKDYYRLALDDLPQPVMGFSAIIPTHPVTGHPLFAWGLAYVQSENWLAVEAEARLVRLFQGEEGAERSFDDVLTRLSQARWELLSNAKQQAIAQPLRQHGVPASLFQNGPLWGLLQRIGRYLDPNFDALHTHVNRGTVLVRPDPTVGRDLFTEAIDTALNLHTPNDGAGWTLQAANFTVLAATDNLQHTATGTDMARKGDDIGDDDMDVSADCTPEGAAARLVGLCGRMASADFDNMYRAFIDAASPNTLKLQKRVADINTGLATYGSALAEGTARTNKLEIRTPAKKVYEDSIERISSADDSLVGNNFAGIIMNGGTSLTRLDNFLSESVAGAAQFMAAVGQLAHAETQAVQYV